MAGSTNMENYLMKIHVCIEEEVLIVAENLECAQDIAQEHWMDLINSIDTFTIVPIRKIEG